MLASHSQRDVTFAVGAKWIALIAAILLIWQVRTVVLLVFAGILAAVLLRSIADLAAGRLRLSARWSMALTLLALAAVLAAAIWLRGSAIAREFAQMWERLPGAAHDLVVRLQQEEWGRWLLSHIGSEQGAPMLAPILSGATRALSLMVTALGGGVVALVISVYLSAESSRYISGILRLLPAAQRTGAKELIDDLGQKLRWWLLARSLSMATVGGVISAGLWILGVPLAGILGILAGVLTFVPNIGPILSAVLAALLAFSLAPGKAVAVILLFALTHMMEGLLITPLLERKAVSLPPALTLSAQMVLAIWVGAIGVMLAAPLVLVGMVFVKHLRRDDEAAALPTTRIKLVSDSQESSAAAR